MNETWNFDNEIALLSALAGSSIGTSLADSWPTLERRKIESAKVIGRYLHVNKDDVLAEIGAGVGLVTHFLSLECRSIISCDISTSYQSIARTVAKNRNVEFKSIVPGDLQALVGLGRQPQI